VGRGLEELEEAVLVVHLLVVVRVEGVVHRVPRNHLSVRGHRDHEARVRPVRVHADAAVYLPERVPRLKIIEPTRAYPPRMGCSRQEARSGIPGLLP
jgi:hypothetical protein